MRNLIKRIFASKPKQPQLNLCLQHNSIKAPILALEHCKSCRLDLCYVCSQYHIGRQCQVRLPTFMNPEPLYPPGELLDKLIAFNSGQLAEMDTTKLKCICGKPLGHTAAMCAACGMASCSEKCHEDWEGAGNCTFVRNFDKVAAGRSMRSILFQNFQILRRANSPPGTKANKSSSNMICSYLSRTPTTIYLQRGFRIYGHPNPSVLQNLHILPKQLDFYLLLQRQCTCQCSICRQKNLHSVASCSDLCSGSRPRTLNELSYVQMYEYECECQCEHCRSGVLGKRHKRINCAPECRESTEKK